MQNAGHAGRPAPCSWLPSAAPGRRRPGNLALASADAGSCAGDARRARPTPPTTPGRTCSSRPRPCGRSSSSSSARTVWRRRASAQDKAGVGQTDVAIEMLQQYLAQLDKEQTRRPDQMVLLRRPVEYAVAEVQDPQDSGGRRQGRLRQQGLSHQAAVTRNNRRGDNKEENVKELMKQFNDILQGGQIRGSRDGRVQAHELDPDNITAIAGMAIAKMGRPSPTPMTRKNQQSRRSSLTRSTRRKHGAGGHRRRIR